MKNMGLSDFSRADAVHWADAASRRPSQAPGFPARIIETRSVKTAWALVRALRVYQWCKNCLLFVPLLCSTAIARVDLLADCLMGAIAFSLTASAGYIFNDLQDRQRDRFCERRRFRPFASGELAPRDGLWAAAVLLVLASFLSLSFLPPAFGVCLGVYLGGSALYTLIFKHCFLLDIGWLAALYVLRMIAGACAVQITPSVWMLSFVACYFLQLAIVKRCADLMLRNGMDSSTAVLPYKQSDLGRLVALGKLSGVASVIILGLLFLVPAALSDFQRPWLLGLAVACVFLWTLRMWQQALTGQIKSDPVWASLRDPASFLCATAVVECILLAA